MRRALGPAAAAVADRPQHLLTLSARRAPASAQLAARYAAVLRLAMSHRRPTCVLGQHRSCALRSSVSPSSATASAAASRRRCTPWPATRIIRWLIRGRVDGERPKIAFAVHRPGIAVRRHGPRAVRDACCVPQDAAGVRRDSAAGARSAAPLRAARRHAGGCRADRSDGLHAAGPVRRRVRARRSCGGHGASNRPSCWATASASTWRPASPGCSASKTGCA